MRAQLSFQPCENKCIVRAKRPPRPRPWGRKQTVGNSLRIAMQHPACRCNADQTPRPGEPLFFSGRIEFHNRTSLITNVCRSLFFLQYRSVTAPPREERQNAKSSRKTDSISVRLCFLHTWSQRQETNSEDRNYSYTNCCKRRVN